MTHPSLARRFAAIGYDALILMAISMLYGFIVVGINLAVNGSPPMGERVSWGGLEPLVFLGWLSTQIGFYCYFWRRTGQTVGMKTWRLQVITMDAHHPTYKQCLTRSVLALISFSALGLGYWYALFDKNKQTLHDRLSKTQTILLPKKKK